MKRLHVHIAVDDLNRSLGFYSTLFGAEPNVLKPDYAKWMLEDPHVNFAISLRNRATGVDHLGIQVESDGELQEFAARLKAAGEQTRDQQSTTCCYAQSNKTWVNDPAGVRWETFYTFGEATTYGGDEPDIKPNASTGCCTRTQCRRGLLRGYRLRLVIMSRADLPDRPYRRVEQGPMNESSCSKAPVNYLHDDMDPIPHTDKADF